MSGIQASIASKHSGRASPFSEARRSCLVQEARPSAAQNTRKQQYACSTRASEAKPSSKRDFIGGLNKAPLKVKKQKSHAVRHLAFGNASEAAVLNMPARRSDVGQLPAEDKASIRASQTHRFVADAGPPRREKGENRTAPGRAEVTRADLLHILSMAQ